MKLMVKIWLLLLAVVVVFMLQQERLSTLVFRHDWPSSQGEKILSGQKRMAEFTARVNRLGAIKINLDVYSQALEGTDTYDALIFRIKEKDAKSWYYQNRYNNIIHGSKWYANLDYERLTHSSIVFPFGFPVIADSRGKTYQIEIESVAGTAAKTFVLNRDRPYFLSLYTRGGIAEFLATKVISLADSLLATPFTIYLLILFLGWLASRRQKISQPYLIWLACLWVLMTGSTLAYLVFGGSEKLEWGIYMVAAAGIIPVSWVLKRAKLAKFQPVFMASWAALILWLLLEGELSWRQLIFLPLGWLTPAILAFFYLDLPYLSLGKMALAWLAAWWGPRLRLGFKPSRRLILILLVPVILILVQKPVDYHHYISYMGPTVDVLAGKQLLQDIPSLYGYLSIHFIAAVLKPFGLSIAHFHLLNSFLFAGYFWLAAMIILKLVKPPLLAAATALIWVTLPTLFSYYSVSFPPQIGPLRFGLSLMIVGILVFLRGNPAVILGSLLAAVALFWSAETAVYVVPAWLMAALAFKRKRAAMGISLFCLFSGLIFLLVLRQGFRFDRFFEFAGSIQGGVVSLPIPLFGNYYPVVLVLILGAVTLVYKFKPLVVFLVVHNLALFSYFVSRSHENNIVNISGFIILELIVILNHSRPKKWQLSVLSLFLILYFFRLTAQALTLKDYIASSARQNWHDWFRSEAVTPWLKTTQPVALLMENGDTRLLIESGITNELPLNPALMHSWLKPGEEYKYIDSAVEKLSSGTLVIVAEDTPDNFLGPVWEKIKRLYELKEIGIMTKEKLTIYAIEAPRI